MTTWREANEELCILIGRENGLRRAFFLPPGYSSDEGGRFMHSMHRHLRSQEPAIRDQLPDTLKSAPITLDPVPTQTIDANNPRFKTLSVLFADRPAYRLCAQVLNDPERPNININPVAAAKYLPET